MRRIRFIYGRYFGTDTKYDELLEWQDVRLYEGAIVEISDNVTLEFSSENAQTSDLKMKEIQMWRNVHFR